MEPVTIDLTINPVILNLVATALNLALYAYGKKHINLGCAVVSGTFAIAFYFFPPGVV